MSKMSDYLENKIMNVTLRNTAYTTPTTVYLALYVNDPTDADIGTESTLGAYVRKPITFDAPTNGVTVNSADISFPIVTSGSETITHWGIRDALTSGNLLYYGELTTPRALVANNQVQLLAGDLSIAIA